MYTARGVIYDTVKVQATLIIVNYNCNTFIVQATVCVASPKEVKAGIITSLLQK